MNIKFPVDSYNNEVRLDMFLSHTLTDISRSRIQKAIKEGVILINEKPGKKSSLLKTDDVVVITDQNLIIPPAEDVEIMPQDMNLDIIWEDENLMAINKPAGIIVHPGNANPDGTILNGVYHYLQDEKSAPRLVHRLDKDTSGVLMVGKNPEAHDKMSRLFARREVYKGYLGFCIGRYPDRTGVIEAKLGRSKIDPIKRTVRPDGRDSRTDYALLRYRSGISAIAFRLHTGRTHQIRVHSAYTGFPIVMDNQYRGDKRKVKLLEPMERAFAYKVFACFHRQALHSRYLAFTHPYTGEEIKLIAPLHKDFEKGMAAMDLTDEDINVFQTPLLDTITN